MWSDSSHSNTFPHSPGLDRLCLHSRLGCVLASGIREGSLVKRGHATPLQDSSTLDTSTQVSAEAAIFVAVIVVFYAAIIVILLGTNMRRPHSSSSSSSSSRRSRSRTRRSRSRSRLRHEVVLDPKDGSVSTQHAAKNKRNSSVPPIPGAHNV